MGTEIPFIDFDQISEYLNLERMNITRTKSKNNNSKKVAKQIKSKTTDEDKSQSAIKLLTKYGVEVTLTNLEIVVDNLSIDRIETYDQWYEVTYCFVYILRSLKVKTYDLIHKISKRSDKYREKKVNDFLKKSCNNIDKKYNQILLIDNFLRFDDNDCYQYYFNPTMTYEGMKLEFEKTHLKIRHPLDFVTTRNGELIDHQTRADILSSYEDKTYIEMETDTNNKIYFKWEKFIKRWISDITIRKYEYMNFIVKEPVPKETYNLFTGYDVEKLPPINDPDYSKISLILSHIKVLTGNHKDSYIYMLKYLAQMIRSPLKGGAKTMIIINSKQGGGKGIFLEFMSKVLGKKYYFTTENLDLVAGQFNVGIKNKILVNLDEIAFSDSKNVIETLKKLITESTVIINDKHKKIDTVNNYCYYIMTTNNTVPIMIPQDDRRFVAFKSDNSYCNNIPYFNALAQCMNDETNVRLFYQFLHEIDISKFNLQENRPKTDYYIDLQSTTIPPMASFLVNYIKNKNNPRNICMGSFRLKFEKFQEEINSKYRLTQNMFGRELKAYDGINEGQTIRIEGTTTKTYDINFNILKKSLIKQNYATKDEFIVGVIPNKNLILEPFEIFCVLNKAVIDKQNQFSDLANIQSNSLKSKEISELSSTGSCNDEDITLSVEGELADYPFL